MINTSWFPFEKSLSCSVTFYLVFLVMQCLVMSDLIIVYLPLMFPLCLPVFIAFPTHSLPLYLASQFLLSHCCDTFNYFDSLFPVITLLVQHSHHLFFSVISLKKGPSLCTSLPSLESRDLDNPYYNLSQYLPHRQSLLSVR